MGKYPEWSIRVAFFLLTLYMTKERTTWGLLEPETITPAGHLSRSYTLFSYSYKMINKSGDVKYVKFHWVSKQGIENLNAKEVAEVQGQDFQHLTRDF